MTRNNLQSMSSDELWALHQKIAATLAAKITATKEVLEDRLRLLNQARGQAIEASSRRPYPAVPPRFRNPDDPSQTWAGRGKRPRWLTAQLRSGKRIDDFRIESVAA